MAILHNILKISHIQQCIKTDQTPKNLKSIWLVYYIFIYTYTVYIYNMLYIINFTNEIMIFTIDVLCNFVKMRLIYKCTCVKFNFINTLLIM